MTTAGYKTCGECGATVGGWRARCDCGHPLRPGAGGAAYRTADEAPAARRAFVAQRPPPRDEGAELDALIRRVDSSAAEAPSPREAARREAPKGWLYCGLALTLPLACMIYGLNERSTRSCSELACLDLLLLAGALVLGSPLVAGLAALTAPAQRPVVAFAALAESVGCGWVLLYG